MILVTSRAETWRFTGVSRKANSIGFPQLAKELVDLRMDVIVAVSPTAIKPAQDATKSIPIVMGFGKDPVRDGFIASLAKPGGNITGVVVAPEDVLAGKRLELLKEAVPRAKTIAVLATSEASSKLQIAEVQKIAPPLGVKLVIVELQNTDYERAFATLAAEKANALFVLASPILNAGREQDHTARRQASNARNVRMARASGRGRHDGLRQQPRRTIRARRVVRRTYFERRQARGFAGGAADEIRAGDQSQDGQADRINDSTERFGQSGSSYPMIWLKSEIRNPKLETIGEDSKGTLNSLARALFRISIFGFRIFFRRIPPNMLARADRVIR